jgi:formylglycine-generating enzyme required for sulfatase activity
MKRKLMIVFMLFCAMTMLAQSFNVSSFRLLEDDLDANNAAEKDQNGEIAALIKVVTTHTGFSFDGGALGIVKAIQKPGVIWVYVPRGLKKITISHSKFGILRDYYLPMAVASARTYEMVLVTGKVETNVRQARTSQYVVFQLEPPNAVVELDGELLQTDEGSATKMMQFGTYSYRVQAPNYLPEAGNITVNDPKNKHVVSVSLVPNFSSVTLTVDDDAEIWVNGERKGTGTWQGNLGAGIYEFETRKQNHRSISTTSEILASSESQTIHLQAPTPILGEANINSSPTKADIYIDGKKVGQTPQKISGLLIGEHQYSILHQGYIDYNGTLTIREGETTQVSATLKDAIPITVTSTNPNATLFIDGMAQGTANGTKTTSFGQHQIRLAADGWRDYTVTINVSDSQRSFNFPMETLRRTINVGNVSFTMICVDGGTFTMGATTEQGSDTNDDEKPAHQVTLSSYYIGETEVTQALWETVMDENPSNLRGKDRPVETVRWDDCQEFIQKLNKKTGLNFRLPTEAEWEYAARGGNKSKGYKYSGSANLDEVAWYTDNSFKTTHVVKTKQANELGLYDMSGNVWEFVQDWMGDYKSLAQTNPKGPASGLYHVSRGGGWGSKARGCRLSGRYGFGKDQRSNTLGLRLALLK